MRRWDESVLRVCVQMRVRLHVVQSAHRLYAVRHGCRAPFLPV